MSRPSFLQRFSRSAAKRADAVLTVFGLPDRVPIATHGRNHRRWIADAGDTTHRLDYDLSPSDTVFDVGGYRGDWAAEINQRFGSCIHVFEPIASYATEIEARFAGVDNVHPHRFGLSARDDTISFALLEDSTSQFKESQQTEACELRCISSFLSEHDIDRVALLKLNIEGGEYDILEHLLETGLITVFENIQVQFHWFVPKARARMAAIQRALQETHGLTFQYPFVWENWMVRAA